MEKRQLNQYKETNKKSINDEQEEQDDGEGEAMISSSSIYETEEHKYIAEEKEIETIPNDQIQPSEEQQKEEEEKVVDNDNDEPPSPPPSPQSPQKEIADSTSTA